MNRGRISECEAAVCSGCAKHEKKVMVTRGEVNEMGSRGESDSESERCQLLAPTDQLSQDLSAVMCAMLSH